MKRYACMWMFNEGLSNEIVYHYSDKERGEHLEGHEGKEVWVVMDTDFFIGTWQLVSRNNLIPFETEEEAKQYIYNLKTLH